MLFERYFKKLFESTIIRKSVSPCDTIHITYRTSLMRNDMRNLESSQQIAPLHDLVLVAMKGCGFVIHVKYKINFQNSSQFQMSLKDRLILISLTQHNKRSTQVIKNPFVAQNGHLKIQIRLIIKECDTPFLSLSLSLCLSVCVYVCTSLSLSFSATKFYQINLPICPYKCHIRPSKS